MLLFLYWQLCFLLISFVCFNSLLFKLLLAKHLAQGLVHNCKHSKSGNSKISCSIYSLVETNCNCYYYYSSIACIHICLSSFSLIFSITGPIFFGNWLSSMYFHSISQPSLPWVDTVPVTDLIFITCPLILINVNKILEGKRNKYLLKVCYENIYIN